MAIVTVAELKEQLNLSDDLGTADDSLLQRKIDAAQGHIERLLGYVIAEEYPTDVPPALVEAVSQLAGHWYENREASAGSSLTVIPFGVLDIVAEYRSWSFGG